MNKENQIMNLFDCTRKAKPKKLEEIEKNISKKIVPQSNQPENIIFRLLPSICLNITNKHLDCLRIQHKEVPTISSLVKFDEGCLKTATTDHFNKLIEEKRELTSNIDSILLGNREIKKEINKALLINDTLLQEQDDFSEQLYQNQLITEQKRQFSFLNISNLQEIKIRLQEELNRSTITIKSIQDKRQLLTETTIHKNNQISLANSEFTILSEKELDIASIEKTLVKNILQTEIEIKKTEKKKYELYLEVNRLQDKKKEHNKSRLVTLSHILTLKPYYKKFLIFRTTSIESNSKLNNCNSHYHQSMINNNRKSLQLNQLTQYKYDYIISSISNPYEEKNINEVDYINNELVNILLPYISQFNQGNEHKNCFVLYISQLSYRMFNETIMTLLNGVLTRFPEYSFNIRFQLKDEMITLNKDIELEKQIDNVKEFPSAFVYELKDEKNVTKMWFCNAGFENGEISSILFKLNEQNQTKIQKKKVKNTNNTKENGNNLFKEINEFNPFYSLGVIDVNVDEINLHYVQSIMNEL